VVVALIVLTGAVVVWKSATGKGGTTSAGSSPSAPLGPSPSPGASPYPAATGPINTVFPGLTTFRGNASRDFYGIGPVPTNPHVIWRYPATGQLCSYSADNGITFRGPTTYWCGTGWTGQPNVLVYPDGMVEVRIGMYDDNYHFINGYTGAQLRPNLVTGDLAKGSATTDSQGYPLYYAGSRDNWFRIVAMDRPKPTVLWKMNAMTSVPNPVWNNDWDGAALELGDYLLEGGENSWFYVIKLNRGFNSQGLVTVHPQIVMKVPGFDKQLIQTIKDHDVSIEDSVAFHNGVAYFSNSGGLIQGWNISDILNGGTQYQRVFRFWGGGDGDPTIAIDPQGMLYVTRHVEDNLPRPTSTARDMQIGDVMKLDPSNQSNPLVWSVQLGSEARGQGILGSPALANGMVYAVAIDGQMAGIDQQTGKVWWRMTMPGPDWGSPVVVNNVLMEGDCSGNLHAWNVSNPHAMPKPTWTLHVDSGCIEATPAVWNGWIYIATRGGAIYGIANPATATKDQQSIANVAWNPRVPLVPGLAPSPSPLPLSPSPSPTG
jgi:outer membrane protein assembly factor BamB